MQRAMFFAESYQRGILTELDAGLILTLNVPDVSDIQRKLEPYRLEMVSFAGVRTIRPVTGGLEFSSSGRKTFCLLEPSNYPNNYVEPSMRQKGTNGYIPHRFKECTIGYSQDNRFRILQPTDSVECYDSFTVEFPVKGDLCVLYFLFSSDIDGDVMPYVRQNISVILRSAVGLSTLDAGRVARGFVSVIAREMVLS